jgi:voltage-gated potassium channel
MAATYDFWRADRGATLVSHPSGAAGRGQDGRVQPEEQVESRRERYERLSSPVVFVLGMLFLVGFVEVVSDAGDTRSGQLLMIVTWVGFLIDLVVRWALDGDPRTFFRRNWYVVLAVLVPIFRVFIVFYVFVRLATGRRRLMARVQIYALYLTLLIVTFGASLVLAAERTYPGSNIQTYGEAVWWAFVTVATVGYGDYTPVSPVGRGLATLMLFNGVAVISVITASVASRFVSDSDAGERPLSLDDLDQRLERIEAALEALRAERDARTGGEGPAPDGSP